jgi:4-amino-4-deoxy-L-arabinose transferase-like glycosyltransferase
MDGRPRGGRWEGPGVKRTLPLALLVLAVLGSISAIWWPMSTDHALFAWVGDTILQGGLPYADAWDHKGPSVYLQSALVQTLFGRNMWGIRVMDLLLLAAGCVAAAGLAGSASRGWATLWAPLVLILLYIPSGWWDTAQPDGWAAFLATVALALVALPGRRRTARALTAGLLLGWLCMYKPPLHLLLTPPVLIVAAARSRGGSDGRSRHVLWSVIAGAAVPVAAFVVWLGLGGALDEAWGTLVGYNVHVYSHVEMGRDDLRGLLIIPLLRLSPMLVLTGWACVLTWRRDRSLAIALLAWLVGGALIMGGQGKLFEYHWHVLAPPLAIGTAIALGELTRSVSGQWREAEGLSRTVMLNSALVVLLTLVLTGPWFVFLQPESRRWLQVTISDMTLKEYYGEDRFELDYFSTSASLEIASHVRAHTEEGDGVLVWGLDPLTYFMSGRLPPTRFGFRKPISTPLREAPELGRRYYAELMADLREDPPKYIIVHHDDLRPVHQMTSAQLLRSLPELWDFVRDRYIKETVIRNAHLWRLRD